MKKKFQIMAIALLGLAVTFNACKKDATDDEAGRLAIQSDDQTLFSNEDDAISNDADNALSEKPAFYGRGTSTTAICNASVAYDSTSNPKTVTITYNGANCAGTRTRTGVVVLSLPLNTTWKDAGAVLTVNIQNLKITRVSDGKSVTINGVRTITNVSGGRLINLAALGTIVHEVKSSGMKVTFDNATERTWQVSKTRTFTYNNGVVITTTGDASNNNISEWGTNRYGTSFTCSISKPMVVRQDCNFRLVSGQIKHVTNTRTSTTTFGLDASGNAVTACPTGAYYFKVEWTGANGNTFTAIRPY